MQPYKNQDPPVQAFGALPINFHYSIGFVALMWQVFIILCVIAGIILTPTVVAQCSE